VNSKGFHGDENPNPRLQRELFEKNDHQSAGINFDKYDDIPVEVSGDNAPPPIETFTASIIGERLMENTKLCGYDKPTPVQRYSIPIGMQNRDLMACAQTGSGKTAGFLFPVLISMIRKGAPPYPSQGGYSRKNYPNSLVLAPTRELVSQIYNEARRFCYCTGIAPVVVYGGADVSTQLRELERGCDLMVATPGRLVDLIERGRISLACVNFLILDEADRMLDMGFEPQIRRIVEEEDMPRERQTFMFSATFPREIQRLAADFMKNYIFLTVGRVGSASKDVTQKVDFVEEQEKIDYLMRFLQGLEDGLILVFVETKRSADYIEHLLFKEGFPACSIHGDKSQRERESALSNFKKGFVPILVATDVAARGLDIPNVTQVINYDLPSNIDDYVHRIGRTGRAGNLGNALAFMNEKNRNIARDLYNLLIENDQDCPQWLEHMAYSSGGGRGGGFSGRGGRGRGGGTGGGSRGRGRRDNFGARDYRREGSFDRPSPAPRTFGGGGGGGSYNNGGGYNQSGGGGYGGSYSTGGGRAAPQDAW